MREAPRRSPANKCVSSDVSLTLRVLPRYWPCGAAGGAARTVSDVKETSRQALLRRGFLLEYATLGWNVVGIVVPAVVAIAANRMVRTVSPAANEGQAS